MLAYLTNELMRRLRLVGGKDVLFGKLKPFVRDHLFETPVDLDDPNVLRNLSEIEPRRTILDTFATAINLLTLVDVGTSSVVSEIKLTSVRPVLVNNQEFVTSDKTVFNRVVGDSHLELRFAKFLDDAKDVQAFAKNTRTVHFAIEYVNASGEIANYYPDFLVRTKPDLVWVVETKGLEDVDVAPKWSRLVTWCTDATGLDPHRAHLQTPLRHRGSLRRAQGRRRQDHGPAQQGPGRRDPRPIRWLAPWRPYTNVGTGHRRSRCHRSSSEACLVGLGRRGC